MNLDNSSPLYFIIDNRSLTGFAEYRVWQQQNSINGLMLSKLPLSPALSSYVVIKTEIGTHQRIHLLFSDIFDFTINITNKRRYTEQYTKRQLTISCRCALARLVKGGHFICKLSDTLTRFTAEIIYLLLSFI